MPDPAALPFLDYQTVFINTVSEYADLNCSTKAAPIAASFIPVVKLPVNFRREPEQLKQLIVHTARRSGEMSWE